MSTAHPASRPRGGGAPSGRPGLLTRIVLLGAVKGTLVMTLICIGASLSLAVVITAALHRLSVMGIAISLAIPAIIVPMTWYPFFLVSERLHAAESRLRAGEEKYRSILESMSEAYVEFDQGGGLAFWNEALVRITGYGPAELEQLRMADFIGPAEAGRVLDPARRLPGSEQSVTLCEYRIAARDGSPRVLEASISPLPDSRGVSGGYRAVIRDVTERINRERERQEYEEQLRRARKMEALGTLAGGVAHDLNNVLSGIVGYPDLLLVDCPEGSALRTSLLAIKESGERAASIVQDLLTLSRRGRAITTQVLDLNRVVTDYLGSPEHARLLKDRPGVRVTTELDPGLPTIEGSAVHISKSVTNLVLNAFEAIPSEGSVTVATRTVFLDRPLRGYDQVRPGDYAVLAVKDSGSGIAPGDLDRVFEPFYTRKAMGRSGTGLGMAVVWGTVKDHEGYVDIRSEVGRGTEVTLYFTASRRELPTQPVSPGLAQYLGHGERILVADDMGDQRELASKLLERIGYRVEAVSSGEEAVARLASSPVDLVLLDMIMGPGMDGLDTCRRIFDISPGQRVIIASGFSETDRVREALSLGCFAYLKKPYRLEGIARLVREALGGESRA